MQRELQSNDTLEHFLRSLAAKQHFSRTGDSIAADRLLAVRPPGGDVAPQWALDDARNHARAVMKQRTALRVAAGRGKGQPSNPDQGKSAGKKSGGKGK